MKKRIPTRDEISRHKLKYDLLLKERAFAAEENLFKQHNSRSNSRLRGIDQLLEIDLKDSINASKIRNRKQKSEANAVARVPNSQYDRLKLIAKEKKDKRLKYAKYV